MMPFEEIIRGADAMAAADVRHFTLDLFNALPQLGLCCIAAFIQGFDVYFW